MLKRLPARLAAGGYSCGGGDQPRDALMHGANTTFAGPKSQCGSGLEAPRHGRHSQLGVGCEHLARVCCDLAFLLLVNLLSHGQGTMPRVKEDGGGRGGYTPRRVAPTPGFAAD